MTAVKLCSRHAAHDALVEALQTLKTTGKIEMAALKDETPNFTRYAVSVASAALALATGKGEGR